MTRAVLSSPGAEAPQARRPFPLVNRDYAWLFFGQAISLVGDLLFDTTLVLWIAAQIARNQPWAPLAVSGIPLAVALPTVVFGPIAGVFADRWDKRRTLVWADASRALLIGALALLSGAIPLPFVPGGRLSNGALLAAIYVAVFLATVCAQFFNPARLALVGDLVPEADRARTSGLAQMTANLAMIAGPPLAAPLFFGLGAQWALLVNALSFAVSFLCVLVVRAPRQDAAPEAGAQPHPRFFDELTAGVRCVVGNRVLRALLVAMVLVLLGGGASETLGFFFVTGNLHATPALYGLLGAASGAGLLLGAALVAWKATRVGVARAFWLGVILTGALELLYARQTGLGPALAVVVLQGVPNAAINVALGPLVLHATPRAMVGRVWGVILPAMSLAALLSALAAGYLDSTLLRGLHVTLLGVSVGPIDTIFTLNGVLSLAGGLFAMRALCQVRLDGDARTPVDAAVRDTVSPLA